MNIARGMGLFVSRVNNIKDYMFSPKNLFYTNVGISISLSAVGDILEQHYEIITVSFFHFSSFFLSVQNF